MRHAGQIVTRTMLLENVWSFHFDPKPTLLKAMSAASAQKSTGGSARR